MSRRLEAGRKASTPERLRAAETGPRQTTPACMGGETRWIHIKISVFAPALQREAATPCGCLRWPFRVTGSQAGKKCPDRIPGLLPATGPVVSPKGILQRHVCRGHMGCNFRGNRRCAEPQEEISVCEPRALENITGVAAAVRVDGSGNRDPGRDFTVSGPRKNRRGCRRPRTGRLTAAIPASMGRALPFSGFVPAGTSAWGAKTFSPLRRYPCLPFRLRLQVQVSGLWTGHCDPRSAPSLGRGNGCACPK